MARERTPEQLRGWIKSGHPWKSKDMEELYAKVPEVWEFSEPDEQFRAQMIADAAFEWSRRLNIKVENILDLGCGKGVVGDHLQSRFRASIVGVDISSTAINVARKRNVANGRKFEVWDARYAELGGNFWDLVTPAEFFYFLTEEEADTVAGKVVKSMSERSLVVMSDHMRKKKWSTHLFTKHGLRELHQARYSHDESVDYAAHGKAPIDSKQSYRILVLGKGV